MKKPEKSPATYNKNNNNKPEKKTTFDLLNKLNGNQLVELANSTMNLAGNGLNYLSERERTTQILAQCDADVQTAMIKRGKAFDAENTKRMAIMHTSWENDKRHEATIKREKNSHAIIMDILDKVERGIISSEQLEQLINAVKSTN